MCVNSVDPSKPYEVGTMIVLLLVLLLAEGDMFKVTELGSGGV